MPLVVSQGSSDGFVVATLIADAARKRLKSLLPAHHIIADELLVHLGVIESTVRHDTIDQRMR